MSNNSIDYEYNKRLALFELDVIKNEKEKLRGKGYKLMDIPDAIAPELRDECYSKSLSMPRCDIEFYKDALEVSKDALAVSKLASSAKDEIIKKLKKENAILNKKLEIAVATLKEYAIIQTHDWIDSQSVAKKALTEIDEVKDA